MFLKKRQRYKALYKKFVSLRKNVQNRKKIIKFFKKQKWSKLLLYVIKQSIWNKRKPYAIYSFYVSRFSSLGNSFKKKFRNELQVKKSFSLFYGGVKKRVFKTKINQIFSKNVKNFNLTLLENFERRLDSVLYRSHFSISLKNAQQMISHKYILVNDKVVTDKSFLLKQGDLIKIKPIYAGIVKKNIKKVKKKFVLFKKQNINVWFFHIPPNYLIIKYKVLQIVMGDIRFFNFSNSFPFWLDVNSLLTNSKKF